jgi:integral membrane sensor domain MASE1
VTKENPVDQHCTGSRLLRFKYFPGHNSRSCILSNATSMAEGLNKMVENSASGSLSQSDFLKVESQTWRRLAIGGAVLIAYFLTAKIGLRFATVNPSATAIWAPSGISVAACIVCGSWIWPAVFAGAFLVNATTYGSLATTLAIAAGNTVEALIGAHLVRRFAGAEKAFERTDDTFRFVFLAAIISTIFSATIGVTSLCLGGYASWSKYVAIWFTWWLGDATGDLIIAPLLISTLSNCSR